MVEDELMNEPFSTDERACPSGPPGPPKMSDSGQRVVV